ncbi:phage recombination protein Bet [Limnobacter sp.]|uniref:phage recombination protein Bet n=1 Tax=Limnobacter sp. TaxID=2003368 RepID=UPI0035247DE1
MSNIVLSQVTKLGESLGMAGDSQELIAVLKNTAFKGSVTDAQMAALLVVANSYGLNPWTKEIYAFPDKNNGIVPVVGVDGWARIINENAQFDGMDFEQDDEKCTCIIYRKDRSHPVKVTEWMSECNRKVGPWNSHPKRMLRHKAMIQCSRLAFGFVGIYEQDEAERIIEAKDVTPSGEPAPLPDYTEAQFDENKAKWHTALNNGKLTAQALIDTISTKFTLSEKQKTAIRNMEPIDQKEAA